VVERCAPCDLQGFVVELTPAPPWEPAAPLPAAPKPAALAGEGYVHDAETNRPLAGAVVTALETGDTALTDEVGRFQIPVAASRVSFAAWHPSGRSGTLDAVTPAQSVGMVNLGVTALREGAAVKGTVLLPDGGPAVGAAVVLRHHGLVRRTVADADGAFALHGLIAADYTLEVLPCAAALGIRQTVRVESSGRIAELRLVAEKPRRVRLVDEAGAPHARGFVVAVDGDGRRAWAQADGEGLALLRGLGATGFAVETARDAAQVQLRLVATATDAEPTTVVAAP
jgi:hypothetical protein